MCIFHFYKRDKLNEQILFMFKGTNLSSRNLARNNNEQSEISDLPVQLSRCHLR